MFLITPFIYSANPSHDPSAELVDILETAVFADACCAQDAMDALTALVKAAGMYVAFDVD